MQVIMLTYYTHFNSESTNGVSFVCIRQHISCSLGENLRNLKLLVHVPSYQKSVVS